MNRPPSDQKRPGLVERVQERYDDLRPAERMVADHLRKRAGTRLDMSITELARALGTSEATVSRVSRALGYAGFSDMKLSLAEGVSAQTSDFANIPAGIDPADPLIVNSARLASLLCASLMGTQRLLDSGPVEACLDAICNARRITLVGVGGAAAVCEEAVHLLMKAGFDVAAYSDTYMQIVASMNLRANDVVIGISHTGTTQNVANALTLARRNGAVAIAITSDPDSAVAREADITLTTWNSGGPAIPLYGDFLEGRISQLFLIDLLYIGLLFRDGGRRAQRLADSGKALEEYFRNTPVRDAEAGEV